MRRGVLILLAIALLSAACSDPECIRATEGDETPPRIQVTVDFRSPGGIMKSVQHATGRPAETVDADPAGEVTVSYFAVDSAGVRSLHPALTIQQTVGIGVERRSVGIDPVASGCPRRELSYRHEVPGTGERRSLIVTAVAENWSGSSSVLEPLTVRMQ